MDKYLEIYMIRNWQFNVFLIQQRDSWRHPCHRRAYKHAPSYVIWYGQTIWLSSLTNRMSWRCVFQYKLCWFKFYQIFCMILQMRKIYLHLTNLIFSAKSTCQRGQDFGGNDCERDQLCLPDGLGSYKCVCGDQDINCIVHK